MGKRESPSANQKRREVLLACIKNLEEVEHLTNLWMMFRAGYDVGSSQVRYTEERLREVVRICAGMYDLLKDVSDERVSLRCMVLMVQVSKLKSEATETLSQLHFFDPNVYTKKMLWEKHLIQKKLRPLAGLVEALKEPVSQLTDEMRFPWNPVDF